MEKIKISEKMRNRKWVEKKDKYIEKMAEYLNNLRKKNQKTAFDKRAFLFLIDEPRSVVYDLMAMMAIKYNWIDSSKRGKFILSPLE